MVKRLVVVGGLLVVVVAALTVAREVTWTDWYSLLRSHGSFESYAIPIRATQLIMDVGITDANGDDVLDIFTTNHNYRQDLLIADGKGGYRDMLTEWGLDQ